MFSILICLYGQINIVACLKGSHGNESQIAQNFASESIGPLEKMVHKEVWCMKGATRVNFLSQIAYFVACVVIIIIIYNNMVHKQAGHPSKLASFAKT